MMCQIVASDPASATATRQVPCMGFNVVVRTIVLVDHSLPHEHSRGASGPVPTGVCDTVMTAAGELVSLLDADDEIIEYDESARWSHLSSTTESPFAFTYGANLADAVALALVEDVRPAHVIVIAHSRPSAHGQPSGDVFFSTPPASPTVLATAAEIDRCAALDVTLDVVVVPPAGAPLPWPDEVRTAIERTGGALVQSTSPTELYDALRTVIAAGA
jgi:hypothetical protein